MNYWFKLFIFLVTIGFVKCSHFVKLIILAGLGLAGLWMVHTLAQDFSSIQNNGGETRDIYKRSVDRSSKSGIDWEKVLSRDPVGCARSFLCQLSATSEENLLEEEVKIMDLLRNTHQENTWANRLLQEAMKNGKQVKTPSQCMKIYRFCPYTSQMMTSLLKLFGRWFPKQNQFS
uniref:Uncharacterized protein LOC114330127 n=1 Tax=Diabrotica virgifera virgifera TaxID=50390 RepID=A0A6P7FGS4_DIAVI